MTTNPDLDQAREVADTIAQSPKAYDSGIQAVARVIASLPDEWIDARLITRDLPEPIINADDGNPEWHAGEHTVDVERVMVRLWTPEGVPWWQTPNQSRTLADALYAAANHAEKDTSE